MAEAGGAVHCTMAAATCASRASEAVLLYAAFPPLLSPPAAAGGGLHRTAMCIATGASRASEAVTSSVAGGHVKCPLRSALASLSPPSKLGAGIAVGPLLAQRTLRLLLLLPW